jgi:hypothetical protein
MNEIEGIGINPDEMLSERERNTSRVADVLVSIDDDLNVKRRRPTKFDLLDITKAGVEDAKKRKDPDLEQKETLHEAVVEIVAGQTPNDAQKEQLKAYFAEQINDWETLADDPKRAGQYKAFAEIFSNLQSEVLGETDETGDDEGEQQKEEYPKYEYQPNKATDVLEKIRGKEVTDKKINAFYKAAEEDLDQQAKDDPDTENPRVQQMFESRRKDIKLAQETLAKLQKPDRDFLAKIEEWDDEAMDAMLSILRVLDLHRGLLYDKSELTDKDEADIKTLDAFSERIKTQAGIHEEDNEED